jgi:hypothetical protein
MLFDIERIPRIQGGKGEDREGEELYQDLRSRGVTCDFEAT